MLENNNKNETVKIDVDLLKTLTPIELKRKNKDIKSFKNIKIEEIENLADLYTPLPEVIKKQYFEKLENWTSSLKDLKEIKANIFLHSLRTIINIYSLLKFKEHNLSNWSLYKEIIELFIRSLNKQSCKLEQEKVNLSFDKYFLKEIEFNILNDKADILLEEIIKTINLPLI